MARIDAREIKPVLTKFLLATERDGSGLSKKQDTEYFKGLKDRARSVGNLLSSASTKLKKTSKSFSGYFGRY